MDASRHSAHADYEWAIELNRFSLSFFGLWPQNNESKRKKIILDIYVIALLNLIIWTCAVPTIHCLFRILDDMMSTIDNLQYTLPILMSMMKIFLMWQKKGDVLPLVNMIKDDWLKPKTPKERKVMIKRARIARLLTILGYFIMLVSFILAAILPIFGISIRYQTNKTDPGKLMPLQTYYAFDRDKSPAYEIIYVLQSLGIMIAATVYSSTDNFFSLLVFHVSGQLENLKERVVNLDRHNDFDRALKHSVQEHKRLIKFINIIDDTFNLMLLGLLFYFGTIFALYGFLFTTIIKEGRNLSTPRLTFLTTASINIFAHTCLYCGVGEMLVEQWEGVYEATYEYKWYAIESRKAKNMFMMMIRGHKSLHLTAGKLFPMTMATFCNLLKTSGGYISVLLAHQE